MATIVVDTTITCDRIKSGHRSRQIDNVLSRFDRCVSTSVGLLEFKATVIQVCIGIHDKLARHGSFTWVRDEMVEAHYRQSQLRAAIFNNIANTYGSSHDTTPVADAKLAEQARHKLAGDIPWLYHTFLRKFEVLSAKIDCSRAKEVPTLGRVAFGVNIPRCERGTNKFCRIEEFIRQDVQPVVARLRAQATELSDQLKGACDVVDRVVGSPAIELDSRQCRSCGDLLISIESMETDVTHAISTNSTEWRLLCALLGVDFVQMLYEKPK